jgi:hypothetical protein
MNDRLKIALMKKCLLLVFIGSFFYSIIVEAQKTEVFGKITESDTGDAIPYARINFGDTYIGTLSDLNGNYNLSSIKATPKVVFSGLGYKSQIISIKLNQVNKLDVVLVKDYVEINEVIVRPGENPAIAMFRKIIAHKKENNPANFPSWRSRLYSKTEFDLKNIKETWQKKKLLSQFDFVFKYIDSLSIQGKTFLPVFFTETFSNYYHNSELNSNREEIIANKASGMKTDMIAQFTGKTFEGIDPYDNYITISDVGLISPLNVLGLDYYKYYLLDSAVVNNRKIYELSFKPKLPQEPVFEGKFWVEEQSFALTRLEMKLSGKANINFLNSLQYSVEYQKIEDKWTPRNELIVVDLNIQKEKKSQMLGMMGRKTNVYENFTFTPVPEETSRKKNSIIVDKGSADKDLLYWEKERPIELQKRETGIYQMVDSIKNVPLYKTISEYIYMFFYGYRDLGTIELGPYYYLFSHNIVEGGRIRVGGRTTMKFNQDVRLNGYTAYGFGDRAFKYGGGFEYYFSKKPRSMISVQAQHDYELLGKSSNAFMEDNILTTVLTKNPFTKLNMIDRVTATFDKEWFKGFSNQLSIASAKIASGPFVPFKDTLNNIVPYIRTGEIKINTRYSPGEYVVQNDFQRTTLTSYKPIINLGLTSGMKGFLGGDYDYLKLDFNITDRILLNPLGFTFFYFQAGKIWGNVPFPLMKIHEGNETYAYDPYAFNLMGYQEFVSDTYASLSLEHHFQGFFLNKIPLFRRLKWREIVGVRTLVGSYDQSQHKDIQFPVGMKGLDSRPYTEFSAGIENIFKVFRVDAVWRYNYNQQAKATLGLLFSFQITL